ncbi:hypothetical protein DICSQDRAFT_65039 [Dichomitus squalens LYAD-421 SS1]|uniref:DUF4484 domain-containing protein n=1 Tax=Dichomitus squalens (strain LYAD-421) TaxID=732165 RepID=R7SUJ7_DICSQ|nr:uncharacterized protein DICSQDRAFT_65039 [Dichomitus squalens LYAD-421 SS1]EJF59440.1 hypothetical protein DICSQDRAFT_65039 [Dichomitus squalens LYAD-421 SS1]
MRSGTHQSLFTPVAIFHASFHRTQGNIIDWSLKASDDLDLTHVEFSSLPSGLHLIERDVIYFTKDDYQGVCVFRRRQTSEHGHRGFRLSSLGILLAKSPRARPWRHVAALKRLVNSIYTALDDRDTMEPTDEDWDPAREFFEQRKVRQTLDDSSASTSSSTGSNWRGWAAELDGSRSDSAPTVHLPHLLRILGPSSLTLYKHILGRRRVLIITLPPVEAACILCQVAADTCYEEQVSELVSTIDPSENEESEPRRLKGKSTSGIKVLGMVTLNDLDKLAFESKSGRGWIACTTDSIFLDKPSYYDLLIDLRSATPNTRPAFYVAKPVDQLNGRGPTHRLSSVRFTWSDVRLWTELDRLLQLDSENGHDLCCDPSQHIGKPRSSTSSTWTDVWRVYEDVCVMCAGLWMGAWRNGNLGPSYPGTTPRRSANWGTGTGSIRLEGDDELNARTRSAPSVRTLGMGIEGRPSGSGSTLNAGRTSRMMRRASTMSAWTWTGIKGANNASDNDNDNDATDTQPATEDVPAMFIPGERSNLPERATPADAATSATRDRQVLTTLALLDTFHAHTTAILSRLATLLETRKQCSPSSSSRRERIVLGGGEGVREGGAVMLTPKDVISFELGPFSGLDARFVEWLGEEYGGGVRVLVKRGWKDLVGLVFGLG